MTQSTPACSTATTKNPSPTSTEAAMTNGHINHVPTDELGDVLAGLIKNGLTFNVTRNNDGTWDVEMTGGH